MNALQKFAGLAVLASSLFAAGCASDVKLDDKAAPVETRTPLGGTAGAGASANGAGQSQVASVDLSKSNVPAVTQARVVYFDLDSYVVKDEYRSILESQAKLLAADRTKKLSIEGHTDERGGSEYNLALGQKRAQAVVKALTVLGASEAQVEAVSFGKERPAAQGSDEAAWAKNRRAELNGR
jgi:peptidoglycan-associated lipoprotein